MVKDNLNESSVYQAFSQTLQTWEDVILVDFTITSSRQLKDNTGVYIQYIYKVTDFRAVISHILSRGCKDECLNALLFAHESIIQQGQNYECRLCVCVGLK